VDAIDALHGKTSEKTIRNIIGELTFRNTYGAFSELVAYKWLNDAKIDFTPQVLMTASDVLNPNGSIIDGQMILAKTSPSPSTSRDLAFTPTRSRYCSSGYRKPSMEKVS
jgi:hypothetical protein